MNEPTHGRGTDPVPPAQIKIGAHVLIQLGRELVTDVEQAILECVKNCYDADAPGCKIEVDTQALVTRVETGPVERLARFDSPSATVRPVIKPIPPPTDDKGPTSEGEWCERTLTCAGTLVIEDKGDGMSSDQLRASWLTVSGSVKRGTSGVPKAKTKDGRTPLGDKGLGRLGTMKLGDVLLVETATSPDLALATAQFRWEDCNTAATVDEVPVAFGSAPNTGRFKGTRVTVLGLNDIQEWRRSNRIHEIVASLAKLISPFEATSTFPVTISVDGVKSSLLAVADEIMSRAMATFEFEWKQSESGDKTLVAKASISRKLLASERSENQKRRTALVFDQDNGAGFAEMLMSPKRLRGYSKKSVSADRKWYVELERQYEWSHLLLSDEKASVDPGPFSGKFYFFHMDRQDNKEASKAAAGVAITSSLLKGLTGVAILRDGFRVRSQGDWLGLSSEMTSGSTYGLRVDNTVGYFKLTGEHNFLMIEKSDREGFVEDAAYRGFLQIARQCRVFATDSLEIVRRSLDQYARQIEQSAAPDLAVPGVPMKVIEQNLRSAQETKVLAERTFHDLDAQIAGLRQEVDEVANPARTVSRAVELAMTARQAMDDVRSKLVTDFEPDIALGFLRREFDDKQDQVVALYESAAVGLSARGLAHDLRTHLDEIGRRTTVIQRVAKAAGNEPAVLPQLRHIRSSCAAIASAASSINPMLPRSRATRETFSVAEFVTEYLDNKSTAFASAGIATKLDLLGHTAVVRANRPRLLQVLDNLVQNSEYWLKRGALTGQSSGNKEIHIEVSASGFIVWDTGPGIDPHVEDRLFDIFVSARPDGDGGQGLGLFIITQLLALDGCTVGLLPARNEYGNFHRFAVDLAPLLAASPSQA